MAKPPTQLKKSKEKLSNDMREKLLIVRMLLYTKDVEGSSKPIKKKQFTSSQGNEFLMSVIFDRNIKWESAWKAGKNFVNKLEDKEDSKKLWMEVIKMKVIIHFGVQNYTFSQPGVQTDSLRGG